MAVKVKLPTQLREAAGNQAEAQVEGATVGGARVGLGARGGAGAPGFACEWGRPRRRGGGPALWRGAGERRAPAPAFGWVRGGAGAPPRGPTLEPAPRRQELPGLEPMPHLT